MKKIETSLKVNNTTTLYNPPNWLVKYINKTMTLDNPNYIEAEKYGRWTGNMDQFIKPYSVTKESITFPRGWTRNCIQILKKNNVQYEIDDQRRTHKPINMPFNAVLRDDQTEAVSKAYKRDFGVLEAPPGAGKTVMALSVIAQRRQPTLVLVHTKELLYQWRDRINTFTGIDPGLVGDGHFSIGSITVAIVDTAKNRLDALPEHFGHIVVDECHRVPAAMFREVATAFDSRYMLGLSATPYRRDGLTKLIYLTLGDRIYQIDRKNLIHKGIIVNPEIIQRKTSYYYPYEDDYQKMINDMVKDQTRNNQIVHDAVEQAKNDSGTALVVSDRVEHCHLLAGQIQKHGLDARALTGRLGKKDRKHIIQDLQAGNIDVLLATNSIIGEGFDYAGFTSLFLLTPIKYKGKLEQTVGRILRPTKDNKKPVIYNYVDEKVGLLKNMAAKIKKVLESISLESNYAC